MTIRAKYENGVFKPLEEVTVAEGTEVQVRVPAAAVEPPKPQWKSIKDSPIFGIWADRDDIPDGETYVDRIRGRVPDRD